MKGFCQLYTAICCEGADFDPFFFQTDLLQHPVGVGQAAPDANVSSEKLTVLLVAGKYENTIRTFFQSLYEIDGVDTTRTGNPDDLHILGELQFQGSCHVRSRISRLITTKSNDFRVERWHINSCNANPKSKYRAKCPSRTNPKQILNSNDQISKRERIEFCISVIWISFGFCVSNLECSRHLLIIPSPSPFIFSSPPQSGRFICA